MNLLKAPRVLYLYEFDFLFLFSLFVIEYICREGRKEGRKKRRQKGKKERIKERKEHSPQNLVIPWSCSSSPLTCQSLSICACAHHAPGSTGWGVGPQLPCGIWLLSSSSLLLYHGAGPSSAFLDSTYKWDHIIFVLLLPGLFHLILCPLG